MTAECCVCCGQVLDVAVAHRYCSVPCAEHQLMALGTLLHSTPHLALSVAEWHDLSSSYATDLELLRLCECKDDPTHVAPQTGHVSAQMKRFVGHV